MNNKLVAGSVLALILAAPSAVSAQAVTGVSNNVRIENGHFKRISDLELDQTEVFTSDSVVESETQAIKLEGYGPNVTATLGFKNGEFTGGVIATTNEPVDPVVIGVFTESDSLVESSLTRETNVEGNLLDVESGYFNGFTLDANSYIK